MGGGGRWGWGRGGGGCEEEIKMTRRRDEITEQMEN